MKKKSIAARLGIAAMALTLITTSLSSGTLAKYTETVSAKASLNVANWNVLAQIDAGNSKTWTMQSAPSTVNKLAETSYKYKTTSSGSAIVADGKIAPGMGGKFTIDVSAKGKNGQTGVATDVDVDYVVLVNKTGAAPTGFKMTGEPSGGSKSEVTFSDGDKSSEYSSLGWELAKGTIPQSQVNKLTKVTVEWEWPYDGNDSTDVTAGRNAGSVEYTFSVVFTQAKPEATT